MTPPAKNVLSNSRCVHCWMIHLENVTFADNKALKKLVGEEGMDTLHGLDSLPRLEMQWGVDEIPFTHRYPWEGGFKEITMTMKLAYLTPKKPW